ncbi:MAG: hypothetical protein JWQ09_127 [Segetibacter sp.]|nr:hypothetical protein [Segetibacter sp.]
MFWDEEMNEKLYQRKRIDNMYVKTKFMKITFVSSCKKEIKAINL